MKTLILAALFVSTQTLACRCQMPPSIEKVVENAELILQGITLQHFEDRDDNYSVNRVQRVLKDTIKIRRYFDNAFKIQTFYSKRSYAACGVDLKMPKGTDYIIIFPKVERSEFGYPKPPLYSGLSSCKSYLYIPNIGSSTNSYQYVLKLLER